MLKRSRFGVLRSLILALGGVILGFGCMEPPAPREHTDGSTAVAAVDATGRRVELPRPATRVISLLPAGTETLLALGAGDHVVGRTRYDTDPRVAGVPSVGGGLDPSLEAIVALGPDLVVAWESPSGSPVRHRLESLGIPVFAVASRDTASIYETIRSLGHLVGFDAAADSLTTSLRAELDAVRAMVPDGPRPSVLFVISVDPPIISGTDNYIAELIEVAGGEPVQISAALRGVSPQVSLEEFVSRQPDVVVLPVGSDRGVGLARLRREPGWRELRAIREGRAAEVPADLVNRPGPSIGNTARLLREIIERHGSAP